MCDEERLQWPPEGEKSEEVIPDKMVLHQVHKKYDLKGSTVEREASEKEKQKKEPTLKV